MIGVYKITNPKGQIYIGSSCNIKNRISHYKCIKPYRISRRRSSKILISLSDFGYDAHLIEVIEICSKLELLSRERYWQDFYDCFGSNGLNMRKVKGDNKIGEITKELSIKLRSLKKLSIEETEKKEWDGITNILDLQTGIYYFNLKDLSFATGYGRSKLIGIFYGNSINRRFIK